MLKEDLVKIRVRMHCFRGQTISADVDLTLFTNSFQGIVRKSATSPDFGISNIPNYMRSAASPL